MSESSQGSGWWQASDGKWYPPETHPEYRASDSMAPPQGGPSLPPTQPAVTQSAVPIQSSPVLAMKAKKPWWRRWWAIALGVLVLVGVIGAVAAPSDDEVTESQPGDTIEAVEVNESEDAGNVDETPDSADPDESAALEDSTTEPATETEPTEPPEPEEPESTIGSRDDPYAVGSPAVVTLDTFGDADDSVWAITVDGPGSDVTQAVLAENQFNEPPEDGKLFYGVPVTLTLQGAAKEPLSPFFNINLEYFGPSSLEIFSGGFSEGCGVTPNELDPLKEVFVGGSVSGMVCYSITSADVEAGVLVTVDEIEGDRVFLATR